MNSQCDIGLIGLAVMGQNLILNMADHGFRVAAYNRTTEKVDAFLAGPAKEKSITGCYSPEELVNSLKKPRRVMLMVKAGEPVSQTIATLTPLLDSGDIIIDGGNSYFKDTEQRLKELAARGILFLGTGISGGEEGARHGPSIMPGGAADAWPHVQPIFQSIAAKVGPDKDIPCCDWVPIMTDSITGGLTVFSAFHLTTKLAPDPPLRLCPLAQTERVRQKQVSL